MFSAALTYQQLKTLFIVVFVTILLSNEGRILKDWINLQLNGNLATFHLKEIKVISTMIITVRINWYLSMYSYS